MKIIKGQKAPSAIVCDVERAKLAAYLDQMTMAELAEYVARRAAADGIQLWEFREALDIHYRGRLFPCD